MTNIRTHFLSLTFNSVLASTHADNHLRRRWRLCNRRYLSVCLFVCLSVCLVGYEQVNRITRKSLIRFARNHCRIIDYCCGENRLHFGIDST